MTSFRIQALNKLDFEWTPTFSRRQRIPKKPSLDDDTTRDRERAVEALEHVQTTAQTQVDREFRSNEVDVAFEPEESEWRSPPRLHPAASQRNLGAWRQERIDLTKRILMARLRN